MSTADDAPVGNRPLGPLPHAEVANLEQALLVQRVQQVKVNVVGLELAELFVQQPVKVVRTLDLPAGQFGGQVHPLTIIAVLEGTAHDHFALPAVVGVSGVDIVHALVDGVVQHGAEFVAGFRRGHGHVRYGRQVCQVEHAMMGGTVVADQAAISRNRTPFWQTHVDK